MGGATLVASQPQTTYAKKAKKNNSRTKSKLSDKQIIKNLNVKKITNTENNDLTKKYQSLVGQTKYTFAYPYIQINPYKNAPLTALMIFHTDQEAQVSYKIIGKTDKTTISNSVKGYQKIIKYQSLAYMLTMIIRLKSL